MLFRSGAFEKFQLLFECSGVIWQIALIFDVLLSALLAYRVFALPAHIPSVKEKIYMDFSSDITLRNEESAIDFQNKKTNI